MKIRVTNKVNRNNEFQVKIFLYKLMHIYACTCACACSATEREQKQFNEISKFYPNQLFCDNNDHKVKPL